MVVCLHARPGRAVARRMVVADSVAVGALLVVGERLIRRSTTIVTATVPNHSRNMMYFFVRPLPCLWVALLCLVAAAGCGTPTATVTGKVTVSGTPVTAGAVTFHGENNFVQSAVIDASGTYRISNAPVGPVKVAVVSSKPRAAPPGGKAPPSHPAGGKSGGAPAASSVAVPDKYKDPAQSGLKFDLKAGEQTIDLPCD